MLAETYKYLGKTTLYLCRMKPHFQRILITVNTDFNNKILIRVNRGFRNTLRWYFNEDTEESMIQLFQMLVQQIIFYCY